MPALVFNKCCGCIDLRTGSLIIGYFTAVCLAILSILTTLLLLSGVAVTAVDKSDFTKEEQETTEAAGTLILVVSGLLLLFVLVGLAFAIVLLVGIHKNKRGHVKAFLIFSVILLIFGLIQFFVKISSETAGEIGGNIVTFALQVYFLMVIRSYYYKMDEINKPPVTYNQA